MSGEGSRANREAPREDRPLEEGGSGGEQGCSPGSEVEPGDAHAPTAVEPAGAACVPSIAGEAGAVPPGITPLGTGGVVPSPKT
jgi:hypothetical protein